MTEPRWRITLDLKTDGATDASYARDVRGESPLGLLGETLHYFAIDTKRPRSDIIGFAGVIVEAGGE